MTVKRLLAGTGIVAAVAVVVFSSHAPLARIGAGQPPTVAARVAESHVLPADARPFGYTLDDMARLTAAFNESDRHGPPPDSPFQILYLSSVTNNTIFQVGPGTYFYVPITFSDDSMPILGDFPPRIEDRDALLNYWYSQSEAGTVLTEITVDGQLASTDARYLSGIRLAEPLPNGATQYIVAAVFLTPLPRGRHSVVIHQKATGDALRVPPFNQSFPEADRTLPICCDRHLRLPPFDQYFPEGYFETSTAYTVIVN